MVPRPRIRSNTSSPLYNRLAVDTQDRTGNASVASVTKRKAIFEVVLVARDQPNAAAAPIRQDAQAAMFDFVQPTAPAAIGQRGGRGSKRGSHCSLRTRRRSSRAPDAIRG